MKKDNCLVAIVLGSRSDSDWAVEIGKYCQEFGLARDIRIASAHKSPKYVLQIIREYEKANKNLVFIAVAGRSNALGGFIDANTYFPVINCPPPSDKYGGLDILSSLRMPSGVGPATVLEADQAAILAAKILALNDQNLRQKIKNYHKDVVKKIISDDRSL